MLDALAPGRPAVVLLAGEPGHRQEPAAGRAGCAGRRARHARAGRKRLGVRADLPFWLFVDALDEYLRAAGPERLDGLGDDVRAPTSPRCCRPGRRRPAPRRPRGDPRYRTHRAMRRVLEVLAAAGPLVLLLDDLHWADSGSVELICALLRRPPVGPVLIGMALRPRQTAGPADRRAAAGAGRRPGDPAGAGPAEPAGCPGVARRRHGRQGCRGSVRREPRQPVLSGPARPDPARPGAAAPRVRPPGDDVPEAVTVAMSDELALLDRNTRRVLEGAAVAGDPFVLELVASAAELSEAAVAEALDLLHAPGSGPADRGAAPLPVPASAAAPRRLRRRAPGVAASARTSASPMRWRPAASRRPGAPTTSCRLPGGAIRPRSRCSGRRATRWSARAPGEAVRWYRAAVDLLPDSAPAPEAARPVDGAGRRARGGRSPRRRPFRAGPGHRDGARGRDAGARSVDRRLRPYRARAGPLRRRAPAPDGGARRPPATLPPSRSALMNAIAQDHLFRLEYGARGRVVAPGRRRR